MCCHWQRWSIHQFTKSQIHQSVLQVIQRVDSVFTRFDWRDDRRLFSVAHRFPEIPIVGKIETGSLSVDQDTHTREKWIGGVHLCDDGDFAGTQPDQGSRWINPEKLNEPANQILIELRSV